MRRRWYRSVRRRSRRGTRRCSRGSGRASRRWRIARVPRGRADARGVSRATRPRRSSRLRGTPRRHRPRRRRLMTPRDSRHRPSRPSRKREPRMSPRSTQSRNARPSEETRGDGGSRSGTTGATRGARCGGAGSMLAMGSGEARFGFARAGRDARRDVRATGGRKGAGEFPGVFRRRRNRGADRSAGTRRAPKRRMTRKPDPTVSRRKTPFCTG